MRTFAKRPAAAPQTSPDKSTLPGRRNSGRSQEARSIFHRTIQPGFELGAPGDAAEQEAERVSSEVMRLPEPTTGRACACGGSCAKCRTENESTRRFSPMETIGNPGRSMKHNPIGSTFQNAMSSSGTPLDGETRAFMESRFGHDFSEVRIHSDHLAAESARSLGALAYTTGNNIVFGAGRYQPGTRDGKKLLAHELTHVLQSVASSKDEAIIRRYPSNTPHGDPVVPGIQHNHAPSGRWRDIQRISASICSSALGNLRRGTSGLPAAAAGAVDCSCAVLSPADVMDASKIRVAAAGPLALVHLNHFLGGTGSDLTVDVNDFIRRDSNVRSEIARRIIASQPRGFFKVSQVSTAIHYSNPEFQFAFGAIDRLDYLYDPAAGVVHVWFADYYEFHPVFRGIYRHMTGDIRRSSNCVHAAAVELTATTASNYWMYGYAAVPVSVFPSVGAPPSTPSAPSGPMVVHTVAPGETLSHLSRRYHVSQNSIVRVNPTITNRGRLQVGQSVTIPLTRYTVQTGDTLSEIARDHGVSVDDILTTNPDITRANRIRAGEEIFIPIP